MKTFIIAAVTASSAHATMPSTAGDMTMPGMPPMSNHHHHHHPPNVHVGHGHSCAPMHMTDSYGDGWNGGMGEFHSANGDGGGAFTLQHGHDGVADICLDGCFSFSVTGGHWRTEVNWNFGGFSGKHGDFTSPKFFEFHDGHVHHVQSCGPPPPAAANQGHGSHGHGSYGPPPMPATGGTGANYGSFGPPPMPSTGGTGGTGANYGGTGANYGGTGANYGGTGANYGGTGANYGGTGANYGGTGANSGGTGANDDPCAAACPMTCMACGPVCENNVFGSDCLNCAMQHGCMECHNCHASMAEQSTPPPAAANDGSFVGDGFGDYGSYGSNYGSDSTTYGSLVEGNAVVAAELVEQGEESASANGLGFAVAGSSLVGLIALTVVARQQRRRQEYETLNTVV